MDVLSRPVVPIKGLIEGFLGQLKFPPRRQYDLDNNPCQLRMI